MTRDDLKKVKVEDKELPKETVDEIMKLYSTSIKEKDDKISELETERDSYKASLDDTKTKLDELSKKDNSEDLEKVKEELETLKAKYDTDTKDLENKLSKNKYDNKVKELTSNLKFSSESAKKSFIRDLEEKGLKFEDDKILGFDDFVSSYKEQDPSAFVKEENNDGNSGVTVSTGDNHNQSTKSSSDIVDLGSALHEMYDK